MRRLKIWSVHIYIYICRYIGIVVVVVVAAGVVVVVVVVVVSSSRLLQHPRPQVLENSSRKGLILFRWLPSSKTAGCPGVSSWPTYSDPKLDFKAASGSAEPPSRPCCR